MSSENIRIIITTPSKPVTAFADCCFVPQLCLEMSVNGILWHVTYAAILLAFDTTHLNYTLKKKGGKKKKLDLNRRYSLGSGDINVCNSVCFEM